MAAYDREVEEALSSLSIKDKPAIFSTDPVAKKLRDSIDYTKKITEVSRMICRYGRTIKIDNNHLFTSSGTKREISWLIDILAQYVDSSHVTIDHNLLQSSTEVPII